MGIERRSEPRAAAEFNAMLLIEGPDMVRVPCRVLDTSSHGFRASHEYAELAAGTLVRLSGPPFGDVAARAVWTSVIGGRIETGFFILTK